MPPCESCNSEILTKFAQKFPTVFGEQKLSTENASRICLTRDLGDGLPTLKNWFNSPSLANSIYCEYIRRTDNRELQSFLKTLKNIVTNFREK